jgi:hypothetical protein
VKDVLGLDAQDPEEDGGVSLSAEQQQDTPFSLTSSLKTSPCYDTDSYGTRFHFSGF